MSTPAHPLPAPGVLRGSDIVCFSQDWTGDPLSKTHLMRLLARDNRILWVNSIGSRTPTVSRQDLGRALRKLRAFSLRVANPEPNIFVLSPLALPFYGSRLARWLNAVALRFQVRRALRRLGFHQVVNWTFNPPAAVVAGKLGESALIYHCVDEYTAFTGVSAQATEAFENFLLRRADLSIVSSEPLLTSRRRVDPHTVLVRHGVDLDHFRKALDPATRVPEELARLPRPIIGFFGLIADWVDLELLRDLARHYAHGSVVLLGKVTTDVSLFAEVPNVHLLGRKEYAELPSYCRGFDVALNPFRINTLTLAANPLKVREYLAAGLPVVSTPIPEVAALGTCHLAAGLEESVRAIDQALTLPGPRRERSDAMRQESWEARLDEIRSHFAEALRRRGGRSSAS